MSDLNIIIDNGNQIETDDFLFFDDEKVEHVPKESTVYDLLVMLGIFKSKTEARKNWNREQLKSGYQEIKNIGKYKKALYILNPI